MLDVNLWYGFDEVWQSPNNVFIQFKNGPEAKEGSIMEIGRVCFFFKLETWVCLEAKKLLNREVLGIPWLSKG